MSEERDLPWNEIQGKKGSDKQVRAVLVEDAAVRLCMEVRSICIDDNLDNFERVYKVNHLAKCFLEEVSSQ